MVTDTKTKHRPTVGFSLLPDLPLGRAKQIEREVRAGFITPDEGHAKIREMRRRNLLDRMGL